MKKQIIANIMCFIIGGIVFGTIGVIAATAINSKDVSYTNTTSKLTSANVQAAVDELAGKLSVGNATAAQILSGKTAMVGGKSVTGTMTNWSSAQTAYTSAPSGKTNGQYCYYRINSGNIELIPSYGYYGTWDWTKSIKIPVPANTNSGTYTYATNSTGGKVDLGATNTYRYVDASNVYAKGKADGTSESKTISVIYNKKYLSSSSSNISVSVPNVTNYKYLIVHYQNGENQHNGFMYFTVSTCALTLINDTWGTRNSANGYKLTVSGTTGTVSVGTNTSSSYITIFGI